MEHTNNIVHLMTNLVLQLSVIIFAAKAGGLVFKKINLPSVLGELIAGIIIGPYMLGAIAIPGFAHGIFPIYTGGSLPISPELYGIATIASIILLFFAGLETDIKLFLKYSFTGSVVGIGGILTSFLIGSITTMLILDIPFMDPKALFMGILSTATSVGITARILSERRKMDIPEGVIILAGAVIDDVFGIILLAIVLGISTIIMKGQGKVEWSHIGLIAFKAIGVWLGFTILGIRFANKISAFLKLFKNNMATAIMALGLALFLAGIFEKAGLAMIIGSYVMGLALSKTDLSYVIQETLAPLEMFFVPIFFTVMGMLVNIKSFMTKEVIIFGILYSIGAILAKLIGCGVPAMFLNFNKIGAARIGFGMVPRGEVALIIAGIGLSYGILDQSIFGVAIIMTLITTISAPPIFDYLLKIKSKGTKKDTDKNAHRVLIYNFHRPKLAEYLVSMIRTYFSKEGFYIYMMELDCKLYQIRKNNIFIKLFQRENDITFHIARPQDVTLVKTIVYESFLKLFDNVKRLKQLTVPKKMKEELIDNEITEITAANTCVKIAKILDKKCITMNLESETKEGVIKELVDILAEYGKIKNKKLVIKEVIERENVISTALKFGLAIPHARTDGVEHVELAIGFHKKGIDFNACDGQPSKIFFLIISSKKQNDPHVQILADIVAVVHDQKIADQLLNLKTKQEVYNFFQKDI